MSHRPQPRPLADWRRHYPLARRIAAAVPIAMLALSTNRLVADIRAVFACSECTAMRAVGFARAATNCGDGRNNRFSYVKTSALAKK